MSLDIPNNDFMERMLLNIMDNGNIKDMLTYINDQLDKDDGSVINFIRGAYLQLIAQEIHKNAVDHGWWDEGERNVGELFMLCVSELAEAFEEYRNGKRMNETYYSKDAQGNDKPEGIPSEIADTIIRLLDICGYYDIDIGKMIMKKHEYNKSRPYRHGNKKC